MTRFVQAVRAAIFGVVLANLANFGALADFQACVSDTHCNATTVCQDNQVLFPGMFGQPAKVCRPMFCNDDNHCPRRRPLCLQGFCQARDESRPTSRQPAGAMMPGTGAACGPGSSMSNTRGRPRYSTWGEETIRLQSAFALRKLFRKAAHGPTARRTAPLSTMRGSPRASRGPPAGPAAQV